MHEKHLGAVLVVDDKGRLVGIFTGRDLVRLLSEGRDPAHAHLSAVVTRNPVCLSPTTPAAEAVRVMREGGFRHVPVVDSGRVVGLVSRNNLAKVGD
jgi:CBS domain-containing protein